MRTSFEHVSEFFIVSGFLCAFIMLADIFNNRPQRMKIMNCVWFLTGIWASWIGLYAYFKIGRACKVKNDDDDDDAAPLDEENQRFGEQTPAEKILLSTLRCGAGCFLANLTVEILAGFADGGVPDWTVRQIPAYLLTLLFGVGFQCVALSPQEKNAVPGKNVRAAFRSGFPVSTAWQAGVSGYGFLIFSGFHDTIVKETSSYWFMMQIAMFCGCLTACVTSLLLANPPK